MGMRSALVLTLWMVLNTPAWGDEEFDQELDRLEQLLELRQRLNALEIAIDLIRNGPDVDPTLPPFGECNGRGCSI